MSIKEKLLGAIGELFPDDLSEEALLQILLDAYARSKQRIIDLDRQHAGIQLAAQRDKEAFLEERRRMRADPAYHATGEYFFELSAVAPQRHRFIVRVTADRVDMYEHLDGERRTAARQLSREDFLK